MPFWLLCTCRGKAPRRHHVPGQAECLARDRIVNFSRGRIPVLALLFLAMSWAASPVPARADGHGCTLRGTAYSAKLSATHLAGSTDQPVLINMELRPDTLPPGYFASANVQIVSAPAQPRITPGFPRISVICPQPGKYVLEIIPSLITKTSCAGVQACSLPPLTITLSIQ